MVKLESHSYSIDVVDKYINNEGNEHVEIRLWCLNKDSEVLLLRVPDFPVFCKIELPIILDNAGRLINWNESSVQDIVYEIYKKLSQKKLKKPESWNFIQSHKLYYYSGGKLYPFILLSFNNIDDMNIASRVCKTLFTKNYGKITLLFRETSIDLYNKMFSLRKLGPTDKFTCEGKLVGKEKISIDSVKEYIIDWKTIEKSDSNWVSYPMIASWDIESYSDNGYSFPQKHLHTDIIFSISITFQRYMKPETRKDFVIIIGPTQKLENITTFRVNNEIEVIEKFYELIKIYDPDVLIGYNIFGFDYDYIDARITDIGLEWENIGRLKNEDCKMKYLSWNSGAYGYIKMNYLLMPGRISIDMLPYIKRDHKLPMYNLNSVGKYFLGENKVDLKATEMFKIHKDIIEITKEIKDKTNCDDVVEGIGKIKSTNDKSFLKKIHSCVKRNTLVVKYNVQDSVLVIRLFEKLNVWISLIEMASIVRVTPMDIFTRGQQVRCIAQLYYEASHKNIVLTQRQTDYIFFNGGRVEDPLVGFWEMVICFDFNSLYPSIMIAYNICYTTLLRSLEGVDKEDYHYFKIEQEEPIDAGPPKEDTFDYGEYDFFGDHDMEVEHEEPEENNIHKTVSRTYEFGFVKKEVNRGLLPEILGNILANRKAVKKKLKENNKNLDYLDNNLFKLIKQNHNLIFSDIKDEKVKTFIKNSLNNVADDTILYNHIEKFTQSYESMKVDSVVYDSRQLALKVSANSAYGLLGAQVKGRFSLIEGSMSVTGIGRGLIEQSGVFFNKEFNATVVYGDTDSTMVYVPSLNNDPSKVWEMADIMEKKINGVPDKYDKDGNLIEKGHKGIFPPPLYLEFEKAMRALFMKKKHYAYMEYDKDGSIIKQKNSDVKQLNVKGIILARRDNCKWLRRNYENIIRSIFDGKDIKFIFKIIIDSIIEVINLKFNITDELSIIKGMGSNYKSKTYFLSIFSELMKSIQKPVQPGERFPYVIVLDHKGRDKIGEKMRTNTMFNEQWEGLNYNLGIPPDYIPKEGNYPPELIDSEYYITNVLARPIDSLFEYGFNKELEKYKDIHYIPTSNKRLKSVSITNPVLMVCQMMKDHKKEISEKGIKCILPKLLKIKEWCLEI